MEDADLLRRYANDRSEEAFGSLVNRHVNLVYSAALRQTNGDHHRAQEVTQMVFVSLAKKAAALVRHPALPAWLYRSTRLAAADQFRRESRRRAHEQAAAADALAEMGPMEAPWEQIRPVLDEEMDRLGERDREAIVLRYFGERSYSEVGRRLGLSENAARMRVDRALDKLKSRLSLRGIHSTGAALAAVLATEAVVAAPAGMAAAATAAATATAASASGVLLFMTANKFAVGAIAAIAAIGSGTIAVQMRANAQIAEQVSALRASVSDLPALRKDNVDLKQALFRAQDLEESNQIGEAALNQAKALRAEIAERQKALSAAAAAKWKAQADRSGAIVGQVYDISQLDRQPVARFQIRPEIPFEMRRQGVNGQVMVDFVVDANGQVHNAYASSSSQKEFEQSAVQAVSQWNFDAGQKGGQLVNTHMQVPIVFQINSDTLPVSPAPAKPGVTTLDAFTVQNGGQAAAIPAPSSWFPETSSASPGK